jgi:hypothetical protein
MMLFAVFGGIAACSIALADSADGASELVQALIDAGYSANPPSPGGEMLIAYEISCSEAMEGRPAQCAVLAPGQLKVIHGKETIVHQTTSVDGSVAESIIEALRSLGVESELEVSDLDCSLNTLPRPNQPYNPRWNCTFDTNVSPNPPTNAPTKPEPVRHS